MSWFGLFVCVHLFLFGEIYIEINCLSVPGLIFLVPGFGLMSWLCLNIFFGFLCISICFSLEKLFGVCSLFVFGLVSLVPSFKGLGLGLGIGQKGGITTPGQDLEFCFSE